jgi:hypothetical protein
MKRKTRTTRIRGKEKLLAHVRRAQASSLSLAEYCRARGLNVQSAYNLRHRLRLSEAEELRRRAIPKGRKPTAKFIAVRVAPVEVTASAACRLQRKGWVIECASLPPAGWLAGLMAGDADAVS